MKLKQWLYGATALAMLAACSDKDIAPGGGGGENGNNPDATGYVGVHIEMPSAPSTRANDDFDDGEASEYALNDAKLLLFQGNDEASATCVGAFELRKSQLNASTDDNTHDQITTRVTRVATVTGVDIDEEKNLYALVIANGNSHGFYTDDIYTDWMQKEKKDNSGATIYDEDNKPVMVGKTIKELQETVLTDSLYTQTKRGVGYASDIVMVNTPLAPKPGGSKNPGVINDPLSVLVKLNSKVWPSEAEALANPAGVIYIERAVGKITCSSFSAGENGPKIIIDGEEYSLSVDKVYWDMAQDMQETYIVRNTNRKPIGNDEGASLWLWSYATDKTLALTAPQGQYRMVGHTIIEEDEEDGNKYRPYFCQVPNYGVAQGSSTTYENKKFCKKTMEEDAAVEWNSNSAFYPRENTFPVRFMKYANTTRIGFWVNFKYTKDGKDVNLNKNFYTKGLDKTTLYFDDENNRDPLTSEVLAELFANDEIKSAVEEALKQEEDVQYSGLDLGKLLNIEYDEAKRAKDGEIVIKTIKFKNDLTKAPYSTDYDGYFAKVPSYTFDETLIKQLNNLDQVYEYKGGKVFYEVRIKHFGDDLTPWDEPAQASTIDESYGKSDSDNTRDKKYLGRYGIVRNNWYDLKVEAITKLGYPKDPQKWDTSWPGKPDDNKDEYIAIKMRVLSWAKRTQSVKF